MSTPLVEELHGLAMGREIYIGYGWLSDEPFVLRFPPPDGDVRIQSGWASAVNFYVARVAPASDSQSGYTHWLVRSRMTQFQRAYVVESAAVTSLADLVKAYRRLVATWQHLCRPARLTMVLLPPYRELEDEDETIAAGRSNPADSADGPQLRTGLKGA